MTAANTIVDFLSSLAPLKLTHLERAIACLWWHSQENSAASLAPSDLADEIESAGYHRPKVASLRGRLKADRRTAKVGKSEFRLTVVAMPSLYEAFGAYRRSKPAKETDSVLPSDLFSGTRGYIERVAYQLNASYDASLYDCSAVMARRLIETLIIEVYEHLGKSDEIKGADGHFLQLSRLIGVLLKDSSISLGRNALSGLRAIKKQGDLSAHNRRYNACVDDISRIRDELRIASEELLHLANLI